MNDTASVATNGNWVTTIMKTSAGISGARFTHAAARATDFTETALCGGALRRTSSARAFPTADHRFR
jgi:hypothetical protein